MTTNNSSPTANPNASFTYSLSGLTLDVDGSGSSDPDGTIVDYSWDFGEGTMGSGVTASHTYAQAGTYTVTLTVTDNLAAMGSLAFVVAPRASNGVPTASFSYDLTGLVIPLQSREKQ